MSDDLDFPGNSKKPELNEKSKKKSKETGLSEIKKNAPVVKEDKKNEVSEVVKKTELAKPDDSKGETKAFIATAENNSKSSKDNKENNKDNKNSKKDPKRKKKIITRIIIGIVAAIVGIIIGVSIFVANYVDDTLDNITYIEPVITQPIVNDEGKVVTIEELREEVEPEIPVIEDEKITNFLLIGIDSRYKTLNEQGGLADVIMIMSINSKDGTIKLVSIARDSYAYIPGYKNPAKINSAMTKGGPELLQLTVESCLRISIDGYAFVNFYNMAEVIDAVGGVYCDVSSAELYSDAGLNDNLAEINSIYGYARDYQQVTQTGNIWLNGRQAVAYARIRHVDSDYKRSERQVEVLRSLLSQFQQLSATGKVSCVDEILSLVATNIPKGDIVEYAVDFLPKMNNMEMQYFQLPLEGFFYSGMYGDEWSIRNNWNATIPVVQQFLYGETTDFDPVADIPKSPSLEKCPTDYDIEGHISR